MKQNRFRIYICLVMIASVCNNGARAAEMPRAGELPSEMMTEVIHASNLPEAAHQIKLLAISNKTWSEYLKNAESVEKLITSLAKQFLGATDIVSRMLVAAYLQLPQAKLFFNTHFAALKEKGILPENYAALLVNAIHVNDSSQEGEAALQKILSQLKSINEHDQITVIKLLRAKDETGFDNPETRDLSDVLDIGIQQADGKFVYLFGVNGYDSTFNGYDSTFLEIGRNNSDGSEDQTFEQHKYKKLIRK